MDRIPPKSSGALPPMLIAFSRAKSRAICRRNRQTSLSSLSILEPRRRLGFRCASHSCCWPTKSSNEVVMADEISKRTEAIQLAAESRERAAQYEALAEEAKQRGDFEMSSKFAASAAEERIEAQRIEE